MKLLVAGDTGLLGRQIVRAAEESHTVIGVSRSADGPSSADHHPIDLTDFSAFRRLVETVRPDALINCVADTSVDRCEESRRSDFVNCALPIQLSGLCREMDVRMIHISTDSVFDNKDSGHRPGEDDIPNPANRYAWSKLMAESLLESNPDALVLRTNFFARPAAPRGLASWIVSSLRAGESIRCFEDVYFAPLFVDHLAEHILKATTDTATGLFHFLASDCVSKFDFARLLAEAYSLDPARVIRSKLAEVSLRAPRPRNTCLSTERVTATLGYRFPTVKDAVADMARSDSGSP